MEHLDGKRRRVERTYLRINSQVPSVLETVSEDVIQYHIICIQVKCLFGGYMAVKKRDYDNESISTLKGADRVRKRPGVIFGSDGLDGCEHAVFEILSNSIDEAREGHGKVITVTRYQDRSIEVEDAGRGCPVDWNEKEQRYNWELVYC